MAKITEIVREKTSCHHYIGYSFQLAASIEININNNNIVVVNILLVLTEAEGNILFNDALNTFYLQLYGVSRSWKEGRKCFI